MIIRRHQMYARTKDFSRTLLSAIAAAALAGLTLTAAARSVQAETLNQWRYSVNSRIDHSMRAPSGFATGKAHVKLTVAPDGTIIDSKLVSNTGGAAVRREVRQVVRRLGQLPALDGATGPVAVSMMLTYAAPGRPEKFVVPVVQVASTTR
jgi:TonB family protein